MHLNCWEIIEADQSWELRVSSIRDLCIKHPVLFHQLASLAQKLTVFRDTTEALFADNTKHLVSFN